MKEQNHKQPKSKAVRIMSTILFILAILLVAGFIYGMVTFDGAKQQIVMMGGGLLLLNLLFMFFFLRRNNMGRR